MIILTRKRALYIIGIVTLFIFSSVFTAYSVKNNKNEYKQTVALPVSNKVIIIDAGHGKPDERG